ncbi:MAG: pyruvate ferredoxin oxidoreductase [Chloroflexi bacterium]|nr:pyruvate ferredoxin oxidoreductase [Chloroflexota bacterium]
MLQHAATLLPLTGNGAVAEAMRQIDPDVVAAFPISPQTEVIEAFSGFVADGRVSTEFVPAESEHSALSVCVGAAAAGARAMTATSAQGLALMWEVLYIAAGLRQPIVMALATRALSAPLNIHCDHSDAMGARDSGWVQLWAANAQDAYDLTLLAVRLAEHAAVQLPVLVCYDGYIVSHGLAGVEVLPDEEVRRFVGRRRAPASLLDLAQPLSVGALALPDYYFELRRAQLEAMARVPAALAECAGALGALTGRDFAPVEGFQLGDADVALVALGSTASTLHDVVAEARRAGQKVGLAHLRTFRPFPAAELVRLLDHVPLVAVLDRAVSPGSAPPLTTEVRAALGGRPPAVGIVYGLGGRQPTLRAWVGLVADLWSCVRHGRPYPPLSYFGLREGA